MCTVNLSLSDGALLYANLGDNVTLLCFSSVRNLCWYKQVAGEQPQIISSFYKHSFYNIFYNQFKDDKRFSVHTGAGFYHLNISNVQDSDSAMYYCGQTSITVTEFSNGTFLVVKGDFFLVFLQSEQSDAVQYVAVDYRKKQSKSRKQRSKEEETVYSGVRLTELE
uniref:Immunoglobulin domain-containing protein n=1 Tax=Seriola dumerili TaxID=41447 RepID=A0A3B4V932_SERDU